MQWSYKEGELEVVLTAQEVALLKNHQSLNSKIQDKNSISVKCSEKAKDIMTLSPHHTEDYGRIIAHHISLSQEGYSVLQETGLVQAALRLHPFDESPVMKVSIYSK